MLLKVMKYKHLQIHSLSNVHTCNLCVLCEYRLEDGSIGQPCPCVIICLASKISQTVALTHEYVKWPE